MSALMILLVVGIAGYGVLCAAHTETVRRDPRRYAVALAVTVAAALAAGIWYSEGAEQRWLDDTEQMVLSAQ